MLCAYDFFPFCKLHAEAMQTIPQFGFSLVISNLFKSVGKLLLISVAVELGPIAHLIANIKIRRHGM